MADFRSDYVDEAELGTILSEDFFFEGEMVAEEPLLIKGKLKGTLKSNSVIYIEESAEVEAEVEASRVVLRGRVKGQISAQKKVELLDRAELEGNIATPDLMIHSGCKFSGCCTMPSRVSSGGNGNG